MNNQILRIWFNNTYILTPYMTIDMNGNVWFDEWAATDGAYGYPNSPIDITDKCCIERSTGFPDKNGKIIYEGDIVIKSDITPLGYGRIRRCEVHWDKTNAAWGITTEYGDGYLLLEFEPSQYEIISTIHEPKDE